MATDYRKWDNFDDSDSDGDASAASGAPTKKTEVGKKSANRGEQAALLKAKARKAEADAVLEAVNNSRGARSTSGFEEALSLYEGAFQSQRRQASSRL